LKVYWRWPLVLLTKAAKRWVCGTGGKIMTVWEMHYMEINISRCHSVHHKSHMDWPGIEIASLRWDSINPRHPAYSRP
jgi:hypothetical protein